ncbi:uncharacterized protein LOC128956423 [Oppia nitens]|uniref:uncharacterized protein LOC128956423 n=1 Tax=Oppia nitens TaxID=1686743 RepID=UPI0023DA2597|nr:uncharacterized protein LOC128956423 [Oppia nitens]
MIIVNNVRQSVENRWRDLVDNGKRFTGISPNVDPNTPPDWFNANKFRKSQQLGRKYYGSLGFGQFLGLMVMLYHTEAYATLTSTGQSSNVQKLFRRYLSTLVHVKHWFDFDPFDVNSQAYQSLKYVRGLHRQVASMLTTKWERMEGRDDLPISQYGMTHAQFAFTGFVALYPKQCGLHGLSDDDFDCLLYFWRVIGYCLGCDDRFNLCNGTADEVVGLCQLMFTREWYPLMSADLPVCEGGVEMAKGICLAMNQLARFISYDVIMKYWYPILSIDNKTVELQTYSEIFCI